MSAAHRVRRRPEGAAWCGVVLVSAVFGILLVAPLVSLFSLAFAHGPRRYLQVLLHPDTRSALSLTAVTIAVAVPVNTLGGLCAAWLLTHFRLRARRAVLVLLDVPLTVSPVVGGLMFVLLLGARTPLGGWLCDAGFRVIYATPGIVLATCFVTLPLVVREVLPVLEARGSDEEWAGRTLGARGPALFLRVTLPGIRAALTHGVIVSTARAAGEFGAVSVVSGHVRGETNTLPLHIEQLFAGDDPVGAFAAASVLSAVGLLGLLARTLLLRGPGGRSNKET